MEMTGMGRKLVWVGAVLLMAVGAGTSRAAGPVDAAAGVLRRTVGERAAGAFRLEVIPPAEGGNDVYEVSAADGVVTVRGSSAVAMAHGAYEYLRDACHCIVTWNGRRVDVPDRLPDYGKKRVVSPFRWRQQYNVCTFGYTTAFWDWDDWQRELDWLALHGFNMALAQVGEEAIWQRVWLEMGLTQREIDETFVGPAHLPWFRMGNIVKWDGPLPHGWNEKQLQLQKRIVGRMRELGIEPVAPAFAGFVPAALKRVHPEVELKHLAWGGFRPEYGADVLDARSALYPVIGKKFIQAWEGEFGRATFFLADTFNEMKVPVPADREGRMETLAAYGDAVYQSIVAAEPKAVWVMQGWLFYYDQKFWDPESVKALLSKVPDDRMVILDLAVDRKAIWKTRGAFYGKQWVYSLLHNMGGKNALGGNLDFFANDPPAALASPEHGRLVGFGLAPEGTENNDVVYELLSDVPWSDKAIDLDAWVKGYCEARYGGYPDSMRRAWDLFRKTCYGERVDHTRATYQHRPTAKPTWKDDRPNDTPEFRRGVELFLAAGDEVGTEKLYQADAIEFTCQYLGSRIDEAIRAALAAHKAGDAAARDRFAADALGLMDDVDALMAAHPLHRLDRWVGKARAWGDTPAERGYYEHNAKLLVTLWGGHFSEYASKVWAGLVRGYYRPRWETFFADLARGGPTDASDIKAWEAKWVGTPGVTPPVRKVEDVLAECRRLVAKGEQLQREVDAAHSVPADAGIAVGKPVRASSTEGKSVAEHAVDGRVERGAFWGAASSPQWLRIDLERVTPVGRIKVYPYWGKGRYYQYTVEVSEDGKAWRQVGDMSRNTKVADEKGDTFDLKEPVRARYVRVTMLKNSVNPGVHLVEVQVFPPAK
jgi:alpha-N-acetylglucosaminidase